MMNNINLYVASKNRLNGSTSSFLVNLPNGFLKQKKEEDLYLNVNGFYLINSWFNIQHNYNNNLFIINDGLYIPITLNEGSPNIYELLDDLNNKLSDFMTISYNRVKNKFIYRNITENSIQILPLNSGGFFGFEDNTINDITTETECDIPINVQGDIMLFLKLYAGDISLENNTLDNLFEGDYKPSYIIFSIPINVPQGALISYNNEDSGDSFKHKISNYHTNIDHFTLAIVNQDGKEITGITDYIVSLQFQKIIENKNIKYLKDIRNIIYNIYEYIRWFGRTYYNMISPYPIY